MDKNELEYDIRELFPYDMWKSMELSIWMDEDNPSDFKATATIIHEPMAITEIIVKAAEQGFQVYASAEIYIDFCTVQKSIRNGTMIIRL